jgi:hypothetical protein
MRVLPRQDNGAIVPEYEGVVTAFEIVGQGQIERFAAFFKCDASSSDKRARVLKSGSLRSSPPLLLRMFRESSGKEIYPIADESQ